MVANLKPMPDSAEANKLGCSCPVGPNGKGEGVTVEGVREWTINPKCALHSKPEWWMPERRGSVR